MSAWTVIAHTEVGSGGATDIQFNSISGSYTDLALLCSLRTNRGDVWDWLKVNFNSNTLNYSARLLYGSGSSAQSVNNGITTYLQAALINGNSATSNTFDNVLIYIPNYSGSTAKSVSIDSVTENNATTAFQLIGAGLWNDNAAITSITLDQEIGTSFNQYSSATLFGILKGSSGGVTVS